MDVTVDQMFQSAYRDAGMTLLEGTGLNDDQTEECRYLFNRFIDSLRQRGLEIFHIGRSLYPIIPGKGDYTVGPDGDLDVDLSGRKTVWPMRIERAGIVLSSPSATPEYPIFPLTLDEWQYWTIKTQATNWPRRFYYEKDYPLGILHLLYVPTDANQLVLYLEQPLTYITATGDTIYDVPPGYQLLLDSNLAVAVARRNPKRAQISPLVVEAAKQSLQDVEISNERPLRRTTDLAKGRGWRSSVLDGNRYGDR